MKRFCFNGIRFNQNDSFNIPTGLKIKLITTFFASAYEVNYQYDN